LSLCEVKDHPWVTDGEAVQALSSAPYAAEAWRGG
jgi:hypothetical protein